MAWKVIGVIIVAAMLTIVTQVGGLIYIASCCFHPFINKESHQCLYTVDR